MDCTDDIGNLRDDGEVSAVASENEGVCNFQSRRSAVFDNLNTVETNLLGNTMRTEPSVDNKRKASPDSYPDEHQISLTDCDSNFRSPHSRAPWARKSDSRQDPTKYTFYNLSDVSNDQLSEKSNTAAAFDFLNGIKKRKFDDAPRSVQENVACADLVTAHHTFSASKSEHDSCASGIQNEHKSYRSGVTMMPEYVVGSPVSRKLKRAPSDRTDMGGADVISLGHLDDVDSTPCGEVDSKQTIGDDSVVDTDTMDTNVIAQPVQFSKNMRKGRRKFRQREGVVEED